MVEWVQGQQILAGSSSVELVLDQGFKLQTQSGDESAAGAKRGLHCCLCGQCEATGGIQFKTQKNISPP